MRFSRPMNNNQPLKIYRRSLDSTCYYACYVNKSKVSHLRLRADALTQSPEIWTKQYWCRQRTCKSTMTAYTHASREVMYSSMSSMLQLEKIHELRLLTGSLVIDRLGLMMKPSLVKHVFPCASCAEPRLRRRTCHKI